MSSNTMYYCHIFDAHYDPETNAWQEEACGSSNRCPYNCQLRPTKHEPSCKCRIKVAWPDTVPAGPAKACDEDHNIGGA